MLRPLSWVTCSLTLFTPDMSGCAKVIPMLQVSSTKGSAALLSAPTAPRGNRRRVITGEFVWPKSVAELHAFDPKLIDKWLVKMKCPYDLVEDFSQDLYALLCEPNKECIAKGYPDKMGLYDPAKLGPEGKPATTIGAWMYWLSRMLKNEYYKLIDAQKKSGTAGPTVISTSCEEVDPDTGRVTWLGMLDATERKLFEASTDTVYSQVTSSMLMKELLDTVEDEMGQEARVVLDLYREFESGTEVARVLGRPVRKVRLIMGDIRGTLASHLGLNSPTTWGGDELATEDEAKQA